MSILHGPVAIADVMRSIQRHEQHGETVTRVIISRNLELQMLAEAWKYYKDDLTTIGTVLEIPVSVDNHLVGSEFIIEREAKRTHD